MVYEIDNVFYMRTENVNGSEGFDGSYVNMSRFVHIVQNLKIARHM